jgi:hypothetical protein
VHVHPTHDGPSISDSRRAALVVHDERCCARGLSLVRPFPQSCHQSANSLTVAQFASPVLVKSSSIAIPFRHGREGSREEGVRLCLFAHRPTDHASQRA